VTGWLARRLGAALATVWAVVTLTFFLIHAAPGTPLIPDGRPMDPDVVARLRTEFGLDEPIHVQYVKYLANVARGNLGVSFAQHRPVTDALADAIPNTLLLGTAALALDFLLGILIGVLQAARRGQRTDLALGGTTLFLYSVPTFWLALLLLLVFGQWLHWFPIGGVSDPVGAASLSWAGQVIDRLHHLALPALTLGAVGAAGTARFQRAALLEVLGQDYVRTARAKGLTERRVIAPHALRNALLPVITLAGLSLPFLLTGAVLIESVFSWPGMGRLATTAIFQRDYPIVTAAAMVAATMVVLGSLLADLVSAWADPRIRVRAP
jgi:peptide/nickel transport system permease protein